MPTPGSPASRTTDPGTTPPPNTRFNSAEGSGSRGWSLEDMEESSTTSVAFVASQPGRPLGVGGAAAISTRGDWEPHPCAGQKPLHLANSLPQDGHMNTDRRSFTLATPHHPIEEFAAEIAPERLRRKDYIIRIAAIITTEGPTIVGPSVSSSVLSALRAGEVSHRCWPSPSLLPVQPWLLPWAWPWLSWK